jgi:hypothetical protein
MKGYNTMKHPRSTLVVLLTLAFAGVLAVAEDRPSKSGTKGTTVSPSMTIEAIEGTTWAGLDSDGDWYEYTFLKGGQLRYGTNTERSKMVFFEKKGDFWAQNGTLVVIPIGNYSVNIGTIDGSVMKGDAWNVTGRRWKWEAKKK